MLRVFTVVCFSAWLLLLPLRGIAQPSSPRPAAAPPLPDMVAPAVRGQFEPTAPVTPPAPKKTTIADAPLTGNLTLDLLTMEAPPPPIAALVDVPPPPPEGCRPVTDKAIALESRAATAQSLKRDLAEQLQIIEEATAMWTKAVDQCEGKAKDRAERNLADNLKAQQKVSEQQGAGPQCESAHKDAATLQDLGRQALTDRRFSDAATLFRKAEDAWDNATELCTGTQQEVAHRKREQSEIDGHNAEYCAPVYELAREQTMKLRTAPPSLPREEKQELSMGAETLWRDAATQCKGPVVDNARNQIQALVRERGTPWVSRYPAGTKAPAPIPVKKVAPPAPPAATQAPAKVAAGSVSANAATKQPSTGSAAPASSKTTQAASAEKSVGATAVGALTSALGSIANAVTAPSVAINAPPAASSPAPAVAKAAPPEPQPPEFTSGTTRFAGKFVRDVDSPTYSGTGKLTWANGDVFDGTLLKSQRHGTGTFAWANGQQYDGDWDHDHPTGQAKVRFVNGNQYEGKVVDGLPHGEGKMRYASEDLYVGQFQSGVPHGRGIYTWKNGQQYDGQWQTDKPEGQGKLRFANGNVYEGSIVNGVPNGQGRLTFPTGEHYLGQVVNGQPDGKGTFTWTTGDQYNGGWKAGKKHGTGVFTWKNGERWEGVYENDQQTDKPLGTK